MATFRYENGKIIAILTPKEQQRALAAQRLGNVAVAPTVEKPVYFSKKDIAAGKGHPCTATPPCSRKLRTVENAAVHATTQAELAVLGHSPDKAPLPKS